MSSVSANANVNHATSGPIQDALDGQAGDLMTGSDKGPRYLYYRLYTREGAIATSKPIYANDPFIGRTLPKLITPPHMARNVINHLCGIEGFSVDTVGSLFESLSSQTAIEESTRLSLKGHDGPGASEDDPIALVVGIWDVTNRSAAGGEHSKDLPDTDSHKPHYVHYHIYDKDGAIPSKTSFNPDDKSLGRIDTLSIAPPHTVASVKARIVKAEGVASAQKIQLFEDMMDDEVLMNDSSMISLFAQTYPGSGEHEPLAIVCGGVDETGIIAQSSQEPQRRSKVSFLKRLTTGWKKTREP